MKPAHIVLLVLAGAVGGAMVMKVVQPPRHHVEVAEIPAAEPVAQQTPAPVAAPTTPAPDPPQATGQQALPASKDVPAESPKPSPSKVVATPAVPKLTPTHHASTKHASMKKPSPMPPPANPRPLVVAQVQPQPAAPAAPTSAAPPTPPEIVAAPAPAAKVSPMPPAPPAAPQPENVTPPAPPQPVPHTVTLNAGLLIPVRLVDGLSSTRNAPGDSFTATLVRELVVDGFVIAERGARVEGRVVSSDRGTRVNGGAGLIVELVRLHTSDNQDVAIETDPFRKHVDPNRRQDLEKVGGGAALGAIIGAIAGGGKGAAIGAGIGGGAGAGDVMLTRQPATLPSETRITFRLRAPVTLTERIE